MFFPNRRGNPHYQRNRGHDAFFYQGQSDRGLNNLSTVAEKGVAGFSKTLGNLQQLVNLAQTAAPMIEQYGPMIKNLPALYKMLKIMNEPEEEPKREVEPKSEQIKGERRELDRTSKPRLFI